MRHQSTTLVPIALALVTGAALYPGGWAVVSVEELPEYAVATQPLDLTFKVLQHGVEPMDGLKPRLEAKSGALEIEASATAGKDRGQYRASLTLPRPGQWTITIHSGFRDSKVTLLPLTAVAAGAAAPPVSDAIRGRQLFVAKGCVGCHVHSAAVGEGVQIGPDLTPRRYDGEYLKKLLADPAGTLPRRPDGPAMPNLALKQHEIAALVAFINDDRRVGQR